MSIVLIGPPGAGKSRVGRALAARVGLPYLDTDSRIVAANGEIPKIFAAHGEAHFRDLERAVVHQALGEAAVVALGGGAVLDQDTRRLLATTTVVLLTVSRDAVATRIANDKRPLIRSIDDWQRLADARAPLYASLADYTVDTSPRTPSAIAEDIADWFERNQRARKKES